MEKSYQIDPTGHYKKHDISPANIILSLGILPNWVMDMRFEHLPVKEALAVQYKFPMPEASGGSVNANGVFSFPGDPDTYPLIKIIRGDEIVYQYPSAVVVLVDCNGVQFRTRMD